MKSSAYFSIRILATVCTILALRSARGDGGIVQLHETRGPFSVTVFTSPEVVSGGLTDVSVLVQSEENGDVVLDADVRLSLFAPEGVAVNETDPICAPSSGGAARRLGIGVAEPQT